MKTHTPSQVLDFDRILSLSFLYFGVWYLLE